MCYFQHSVVVGNAIQLPPCPQMLNLIIIIHLPSKRTLSSNQTSAWFLPKKEVISRRKKQYKQTSKHNPNIEQIHCQGLWKDGYISVTANHPHPPRPPNKTQSVFFWGGNPFSFLLYSTTTSWVLHLGYWTACKSFEEKHCQYRTEITSNAECNNNHHEMFFKNWYSHWGFLTASNHIENEGWCKNGSLSERVIIHIIRWETWHMEAEVSD